MFEPIDSPPFGIAALVLVAIFTAPALKGFIWAGNERRVDQFLNDSRARYFVSGGAALGLSSALLRVNESGYATSSSSDRLALALWVLLAVQALSIFTARDMPRGFKYGVFSASSSIVMLLSLICPAAYMQTCRPYLPWTQLFAALLQLAASTCLPQRRPQTAADGEDFSEEHAASIVSLLFFSWANSGRNIRTVQDLPRAPQARTSTLCDSFQLYGGHGPLWRKLVKAYRFPILIQISLIICSSFFQFATRFALHQLLVHLERPSGDSLQQWIYVMCLGTGLVADGIASAWVIWFTQMRMSSPATSMIKSLLFDKSTRLRLQTEANQTANASVEDGGDSPLSLVDLMDKDTVSICRVFSLWRSFPMALLKILFDMTYLATLIGTQSILIGAAASLVFLPLSSNLSERLGKRQKELTKAHATLFNGISEALSSLRQIRFSSTETTWQTKLLSARASELAILWASNASLAALTLVSDLSPIMLSTVALSVYSYSSSGLSPSVAFGALSLLDNLHIIVRELPIAGANMRESWLSCQRVQRFLDRPEQPSESMHGESICLREVSVAWPAENAGPAGKSDFVLENVSLEFPNGELSIITGHTGSGKSLLVAALLDEAEVQKGQILKRHADTTNGMTTEMRNTPSLTAVVTQPPWIDDSTVRGNILFGSEFDEKRYRKVLTACALERDIESMPDNDLTRAGRGGSMLSGGQRWRVALARALYSPADTLILEDVLGAVDPHVAKWIFENALTGELADGRTRVLVTHHSELCRDATKYLVHVHNGSAHGRLQTESFTHRTTSGIGTLMGPKRGAATTSKAQPKAANPEAANPESEKIHIAASMRPTHTTFLAYLRACGGLPACLLGVLITLGCRATSSAHAWWLTRWTKQLENHDSALYNILVFILLSFGDGIAVAVQTLVFSSISVRASRTLFRRAITSPLHASLAWIDRTSLSKVLQALGDDIHWVDHRVSKELNGLLRTSVQLGFIIFTSLRSGPYTGILSPILVAAFAFTVSEYLAHSRRLIRLVPSALRPILDHASSTQAGISTIRAFGRSPVYRNQMHDLLDVDLRLSRQLILCQRRFHLRMSLYGAAFVVVTAGALVYSGSDAATAGFTISLALQMKATLSGISGKLGALQRCASALDRVLDLAAAPTESPGGTEPPDQWPSQGAVSVRQLSARYNEDLPLAIDDITFNVDPCQRLGVVGRTGSGKTTLINALLRFIDISSGKVTIDGVDTSSVSIASLRKAVTIIPQDPFLFSGTLRENLDMERGYLDKHLQTALMRVQFNAARAHGNLKSGQNGLFDLDAAVCAGGKNMSHGQRQLICLARALLSGCRILILDEATSSVDLETDAAVQRIIRQEFRNVTTVVIAHRLSTVADFESVLVLESGRVAEFGPPWELMERKKVFYNMVEESGDRERIRGVIEASVQSRRHVSVNTHGAEQTVAAGVKLIPVKHSI